MYCLLVLAVAQFCCRKWQRNYRTRLVWFQMFLPFGVPRCDRPFRSQPLTVRYPVLRKLSRNPAESRAVMHIAICSQAPLGGEVLGTKIAHVLFPQLVNFENLGLYNGQFQGGSASQIFCFEVEGHLLYHLLSPAFQTRCRIMCQLVASACPFLCVCVCVYLCLCVSVRLCVVVGGVWWGLWGPL